MTPRRRCCTRLFLLCPLFLAASCSAPPPPAEPEQSQEAPSVSSPTQATASVPTAVLSDSVALDWLSTLSHILVADMDGDGLQDLTLVGHVEGVVMTYYQESDGSFSRTDPLDNVGFHPNDTLALTAPEGTTYLMVNAEGANNLRFYRPKRHAAAEFVTEVSSPSPKRSVVFSWPGAGAGAGRQSRRDPEELRRGSHLQRS